MKQYQPIIGLEVHVELATKSKMFCSCPSEHFGIEPNTHTCPVCLGLPGALPVPNKKAVESTIMLGLALGCKINEISKFDRKNYFYPDLPKGYQISQYDEPIAISGSLKIKNQNSKFKNIRIRRVHLEEDTGKLQHAEINGEDVSLVDFNRSGVPLVEIVTEPDFRSVEEVDQYLRKLQKIIRYLGISGADMEKGSMRLEPSISLTSVPVYPSTSLPNYRVELKNINSFRFARKALEYEIERQTKLLEAGEKPVQQTRGWNEAKNVTFVQREKEGESDYRYFPEPDIPPLRFTNDQITMIKKMIPELPEAKSDRFQRDFGLSPYASDILTEDKSVAEYFEEAVKIAKTTGLPDYPSTVKDIANGIINKKVDLSSTAPAQLVQQILKSKQTSTVSEEELEKVISEVLLKNQNIIEDFKVKGEKVLGTLIGQVRQIVNADPKLISQILIKKINLMKNVR